MVRWWAAFFVLGLVFPAHFQAELLAFLVATSLLFFSQANKCMRPALRYDLKEQSRLAKTLSYYAIVCSTSIIVWGAAGMERTAHDAALAGAAHERYGSRGLGETAARRGSAQKGDGIEFGIRSLSLWDERSRLLELLDDGRLSKRGRGIVGALVLDDRSGLDWRLSETYSYLGITHLLALSGMHLGVIAVPLSRILSLLIRSKRLRDVLLFSVLCLYSAVAGFPPSLLRALALCAVVIGHGHLSLHGDLLSALIAGSFALAAIDSSVVFDAGFQLSCAAVCGIALIDIPLSRKVESCLPGGVRGVLLKTILFPALMTCSVQFFTLPLVITLFNRSSLLSPIVNVLVSLPFTALLYAGVLYVFVPFGPLRALLSLPMNALCRLLDDVPSSFSHSPHAAIYRGDFNAWLYCAGAAAVAWGLRKSCGQKRRAFVAGAACIVLSFVASSHAWRDVGISPTCGAREKTVDGRLHRRTGSVYVASGSGIIYIGEKFGMRESYRLTRELWRGGVRKIGYCVVKPSRVWKNQGFFYFLGRISVKEVIVSPYLLRTEKGFRERMAAKGIAVTTVSAGDRIDTGFVCIEVIGPLYPPPLGTTVMGADATLRCRLITESGMGPSTARDTCSAVSIDPDDGCEQ